MEDKDKKKILIKTIVGIVLFLLIIVGATYAYFSVDVLNNTTSKNNRVSLQKQYIINASGGANMGLLLTNDMVAAGIPDTTYYASSKGASTSEVSETFASLSTAATEPLNCTYKIEVTKSSTGTDLFNAVKTNGVTNELLLAITSTSGLNQVYDMKNAVWTNNKLTIDGTLTGLKEGVVIDFKAKLYLNIFANKVQNYLSGASSDLDIKMVDVDCKVA